MLRIERGEYNLLRAPLRSDELFVPILRHCPGRAWNSFFVILLYYVTFGYTKNNEQRNSSVCLQRLQGQAHGFDGRVQPLGKIIVRSARCLKLQHDLHCVHEARSLRVKVRVVCTPRSGAVG